MIIIAIRQRLQPLPGFAYVYRLFQLAPRRHSPESNPNEFQLENTQHPPGMVNSDKAGVQNVAI